ncbi:MAG: hypothetical protein G8D91_00365 [gamma proteobacterium symbiont of Clathrolucina costata]
MSQKLEKMKLLCNVEHLSYIADDEDLPNNFDQLRKAVNQLSNITIPRDEAIDLFMSFYASEATILFDQANGNAYYARDWAESLIQHSVVNPNEWVFAFDPYDLLYPSNDGPLDITQEVADGEWFFDEITNEAYKVEDAA